MKAILVVARFATRPFAAASAFKFLVFHFEYQHSCFN